MFGTYAKLTQDTGSLGIHLCGEMLGNPSLSTNHRRAVLEINEINTLSLACHLRGDRALWMYSFS
jgi:hypothetical protein